MSDPGMSAHGVRVVEPADGVWASDHVGVVADLAVRGPGDPP